jgi:hypothetical protein
MTNKLIVCSLWSVTLLQICGVVNIDGSVLGVQFYNAELMSKYYSEIEFSLFGERNSKILREVSLRIRIVVETSMSISTIYFSCSRSSYVPDQVILTTLK